MVTATDVREVFPDVRGVEVVGTADARGFLKCKGPALRSTTCKLTLDTPRVIDAYSTISLTVDIVSIATGAETTHDWDFTTSGPRRLADYRELPPSAGADAGSIARRVACSSATTSSSSGSPPWVTCPRRTGTPNAAGRPTCCRDSSPRPPPACDRRRATAGAATDRACAPARLAPCPPPDSTDEGLGDPAGGPCGDPVARPWAYTTDTVGFTVGGRRSAVGGRRLAVGSWKTQVGSRRRHESSRGGIPQASHLPGETADRKPCEHPAPEAGRRRDCRPLPQPETLGAQTTRCGRREHTTR